MRKPAHPGQILLDGFIEPNNIKIKELADHLGFSRETLSRVLHGKNTNDCKFSVKFRRGRN
ncbi:Plasmid maintenance system antidote protein [Mannheimia haemolytica]|uniref:Plasmid maintenance system antidote protein n=1 Tax=Mannheimia haemolytica TaxID=75985 RepID=A0A378N0F3_MANHA|nr:Plasmid maintenance system antidote protein [Mannheimia haemolytica]